jgi:NAD(P)-dependent dehydrogenase (short-subunit alcohol dehydrogenase family)
MDDAPTHNAHPWPEGGLALVIGASGGIGEALLTRLQGDGRFARMLGLSRHSQPALDLLDEASIAQAAAHVAGLGVPLRLLIDATGLLHGQGLQPEKSWQQLDPVQMAQAFAINAIGPALLMKHFLPLLPREGRAVFATLSAKVGSIGDNQLGGWYSYRASKAALNQLVRTAAIELRRSQPHTVVVALHPGTVSTALSAPFRGGEIGRAPDLAAAQMLATVDALSPADSGAFVAYDGQRLPW